MRAIRAFLHRVCDLARKDTLERELDDELRFHLEMEAEERRRSGLPPEEARAVARHGLGLPERVKEDIRRQHGFVRLETLWGDLRFALRGLRRQPGFTAAAILTLALGIGAGTAIFSVVRGVLLRPLPFAEPDRLVQLLGYDRREGLDHGTISYPDFLDVREGAEAFESMAAYDEWEILTSRDGAAEKIFGASVSAGFFETLGLLPAAGRFFLPAEDEPGTARVAVLSHGLWSRLFGADPAVVGSDLELNGIVYEVVGVAPERFEDPGLSGFGIAAPEIWRATPGYFGTGSSRSARAFTAIGRLRSGVPIAAARTELDTLMRRLERAYPDTNAQETMTAEPLMDRIVGGVRRPLWLLLWAAGLVLLIACGNVASLLLARAERRVGELAVRSMVGASRGQIVRQLLVESAALAGLGAGLGLAVAAGGVRALAAAGAAQVPRWSEVTLDGAVLAFAAALAIATGLVFGLVPALRISRRDLNRSIGEAHRGAAQGSGRSRSRKLLIAAEVAFSLVLLVGSGLLLRSLAKLQAVDPGLDADGLLTARLTTPAGPYDEAPAALALYDGLLERLAAVPGASSAATINILPLSGNFDGRGFTIDGRPEPAAGEGPSAETRAVSPGFFRTAGVPVLEGRPFQHSDGAEAPRVAVIDRAAEERFFRGTSALGQRLTLMDESREIVGVVGNLRQFALDRPAEPTLYLPHPQTSAALWIDSAVLVRTSGEPEDLAGGVREAVREVDPRIAVEALLPMARVVGDTAGQARFRTTLLSAFAALALVLGIVGLYGVVAYATAGRSREMGIRMALGAERRKVLALVMREGFAPALAGALVGLAAALALARSLEGLLFGVEPTDPLTLLGATAALLGTAAVACFLPARRATRVDPVETLRA